MQLYTIKPLQWVNGKAVNPIKTYKITKNEKITKYPYRLEYFTNGESEYPTIKGFATIEEAIKFCDTDYFDDVTDMLIPA